jgi:hypothetical protein
MPQRGYHSTTVHGAEPVQDVLDVRDEGAHHFQLGTEYYVTVRVSPGHLAAGRAARVRDRARTT